HDHLCYTTDLPRSFVLNMSDEPDKMEYKSCNPKNKLQNAQWRHPKKLQIVARPEREFVYRDFVASRNGGDGVLVIKNQTPGLYWMTLTVFDSKADAGPLTVACGDQKLVDSVNIPSGTCLVKTVPLWIKSAETSIRFSGNWKLNALALQLTMGEREDYQFNRSYWNMKCEGE
ncbi:MAG: hypothetical protein U9N87_05315, partial [Planctomycetota bacterium]|nr:hypothetical protein [Planctomycetota bacterium]